MDTKTKRLLLVSCEKGTSSLLSALPVKKRGYVLNKQEFRDALCLRYISSGYSISLQMWKEEYSRSMNRSHLVLDMQTGRIREPLSQCFDECGG